MAMRTLPWIFSSALTSVYDTLRYDLEINYRKPPDVSFSKSEAALAAACRRSAVN